MDKRIIHAVAGSGKTRYIIESLDLDTRIAIKYLKCLLMGNVNISIELIVFLM